MLIIRNEQMRVLSAWMQQEFERRAVLYLRTKYPKKMQDKHDDYLHDIVREGIAKAGQYGIDGEDDVLRYLDYMIDLGTDFDIDTRYPWAQSILNDSRYPATSKMNRLDNREYALLEVTED